MLGSDGSVRRSNFTTTFVSIILNSATKINLNSLLSSVMSVSSFTLSVVSVCTLMALSVDRLFALLLGLRYRQVVTLRRVFAAICCFWLMGIACGFIYSFWSHLLVYITGAVIGILFLCVSIFCYTKIFLTLRQRQTQVQLGTGHERVTGAGFHST